MEPVDNTDYYKLDVVPGAFVAVLGQNAHGVHSRDDLFVSALSEDGTVLWHEAGTAAFAREIAASRKAVVFATEFSGSLDYQGQRAFNDNSAAFLARLDEKGKLAWGRVLGTPSFTRVDALAQTPEGGAVIALGIFAAAKTGPLAVRVAGGKDAIVVAYDKAGEIAWSHPFGFAGYDEAEALFVDAAGDIVVGGRRYRSGSNWSMSHADGPCHGWVARLGPKGEERWRTDLGQGAARVTVSRMAPAPGGEIVVSGSIAGKQRLGNVELDAPAKDARYVARLGGDGKVLSARLLEPGDSHGCITVDAAGRVIFADERGIFEEPPAGARRTLLSFKDSGVSRVSDCRLDGAGHLYIAATASPGARIGDKTLAGPLRKRRTAWLKPYSVGFVAKIALSPEARQAP